MNKEHQIFLKEVQTKKQTLNDKDYRSYLNNMIKRKEGELAGISGRKYREEGMISQNDSQDSHSRQDLYHFKSQTHSMNWHNLEEREKLVNKQLFFLRSQLSSFE
ncbi:hypothetical protein OAT67_08190 [Bacteriovoracaceae bacterium]|nr:hypothetical protein [Bacteriovoracaceae bacterium]